MPEPESKIGQILDLLKQQPKPPDPLSFLRDNWMLLAAIVSVALFFGKLEQRVTHLEQTTQYLHGDVHVPGDK